MIMTLTFPSDTLDKTASFAFEYFNYRKEPVRGEGYLFNDETTGQIFLMKCPSSLQSHYSAAEIAHNERIYRGDNVVTHGDTVSVGGKQYLVKILGNYSDAGRLIAIDAVQS